MKIKIVKIISANIVEFSTNVGIGIGTWNNNEIKEGAQYTVELDIEQKLEIGNNVKIVSEKGCFIRYSEHENEIQGVIDGVDEDGMIYLRLSIDCLIMIESPKEHFKEGDYLLLTVNVNNLRITEV